MRFRVSLDFDILIESFISLSGAERAPRSPLKLEKIWFFTRNTPKMFAPPSGRRNFFKCAPYLEILDPPLLMYYSDGRSNFPWI
jgi:hypothetical protein